MPVSEGKLLCEAHGAQRALDRAGAEHGECWRSAPLEYERRVSEFFDRSV